MCEHLFVFLCRSKSSQCRWGHIPSSLPHHPGTQCPLEKHGKIISSCYTFYETDIIALGGFLMSAPCLFPAPQPSPFKQMPQSLTRKNALMVHFTHFLLFSHPDLESMLHSSAMTKTLENVICFKKSHVKRAPQGQEMVKKHNEPMDLAVGPHTSDITLYPNRRPRNLFFVPSF